MTAVVNGYASRSSIFTTAGANSFVVPTNVSRVLVTMVGGGTGGAGGHATGGGGGGGGPGQTLVSWPLAVTPGSTLTCTVGAKSAGGAIASAPSAATDSTVTGGLHAIPVAQAGYAPTAGGVANGGNGGASGVDPTAGVGIVSYAAATGGAAAGATGSVTLPASNFIGGTGGGAGAGTGSGGGGISRSFTGTFVAGGANVGGGGGGCTPFGDGGAGTAATVTGTAAGATAYGAGGGGGGQNAAGGAGCDGMILIEYTS